MEISVLEFCIAERCPLDKTALAKLKRHSLNVVNGPKLAPVAFRPFLKTHSTAVRPSANCACFKVSRLLNVVFWMKTGNAK